MKYRVSTLIIYLNIIIVILCLSLLPQHIKNDLISNIEDTIITSIIKTKFILDTKTDAFAIHINTTKGTVTLNGKVKDQNIENYIISLIKNTPRVHEIISKLEFEQPIEYIAIEFELDEEYDYSIDQSIQRLKAFYQDFKKTLLKILHHNKSLPDYPSKIYFSENMQECIITVELPKIKKEDLLLKITKNRFFTIKGTIENTQEEELKYYLVKKSYRTFENSIFLPDHCDLNQARASLKDDILTINIAKNK